VLFAALHRLFAANTHPYMINPFLNLSLSYIILCFGSFSFYVLARFHFMFWLNFILCAADYRIDAQLFENINVFRIIDPGNRSLNIKIIFCQLAGNQIILIKARDSD